MAMKRWQKIVAVCVIVLVVTAGFVAFALPGIVKSQAMRKVEAATGRKLAIGDISINPFTWNVEIRDVRFTERDRSTTFVAFSSVRIAVSPASIYRRAPVVSETRIASPHISIVRTGANTYNFSDLMQGKEEKKSDGKRPLFSLNNIMVENGSLDFIDRGIPVEKHHKIRKIRIGIPFVSTIPYMADRYIAPHFSSLVNGSPLVLEGKLKPFAKAVEASLSLDLKTVSLPFYAAYLPTALPVRIDSGTMSSKIDVSYRIAQKEQPELEMKGNVTLADARVAERSGAPLVALKQLAVGIASARLLSTEIDLSSLSADGLEANISRDAGGVWNFQRLTGPKPPPSSSPPPQPGRKLLLTLAEAHLKNGRVELSDAFPPGGFNGVVEGITLDMRGFSTAQGKKATYSLAFTTPRGEKGSFKGEFGLEPVAAMSSVEVTGLVMEAYYPYLAAFLSAPIKGRLDLGGDVAFSQPDGLKLEKGSARIGKLSVPFGKKDGASLAKLACEGVTFSQKDNSFEVGSVTLKDGDIRVSRDGSGALSPLALLRDSGKAKKPAARKEGGGAPPLHYRVRSIAGAGLNLAFTDGMKEEQPTFSLRKTGFALENVSGPKMATIPFRLAGTYGKNGVVKASGKLRPEPLNVNGTCTLQRIPLTDFDAYLPENLDVTLADGSLDTRMSFTLAKGAAGLTGTFGGDLGVRSFYCLDADSEDLLKWESLQLETIKGSISPFTLSIADIALNNFYSKIVVNKDGTLNLQHLMKPAAGEKPAEGGKPAAPPQATPAVAPKAKAITIGAVTMQGGVLSFTDHHLPNEYATTFYNLGGKVGGLSSEESKFADVDLRGNLENHSPLKITGQINPLRDDLFVDLKVSFTDIELSPLTPYSGTYLGYSVDKGKLFLDLKYRIEKKKLDSENKVFIDQFTFGRKIESDKATNLPVRLAVALLKDRKGEIHLDLPVTGQTDDPKFSVWRVILQILKNLLVKAATSPFSLLQSAFGGKEDFSSVGFAYGSSSLSPEEKDKLHKLATALGDRPGLKISVTGFVERERDAEGYRNEVLQKKIRGEKFLDLVKEKKVQPGGTPDTVQISSEEYTKYLKVVYKKEKFPKPRNVLGLVKDIPDAEMKKLILVNTTVGDEQLKALAAERAAAVRTFLVQQGKLDAARIFQKGGDVFKPPEKEGVKGSRVEFGAGVE